MSTFFSNLDRLRPPEFKDNDAAYQRFLGVPRTTFFDWKIKHEAGRNFTPNAQLVEKCASALGVTVAVLWAENGKETTHAQA